MNVRRQFLGSIVGVLLGIGLAVGQQPAATPTYNLPNSPTPMPELPVDPESTSLPKVVSNWVSYRDKVPPDSPADAPCTNWIGSEIFLRSGSSTLFGGGVFPSVLNTGWLIDGGARVMFYNDAATQAWTLQASVSNIYNSAHENDETVRINHVITAGEAGEAVTEAHIRDLNRTFLNLGIGHDWYVWKPNRDPNKQCCDGFLGNSTLSWGLDGGGRYGTGRVQYVEIMHTTGVLTGAYAGLHSELQIPMGCNCTWELGWRFEWGVTHSNVLIQTSNTFYDANLMLTTGIRY